MVVQLCNEWTMVLICSLPVNPTMHAHAGPAVWEWWGILIKIQCACNYVYMVALLYMVINMTDPWCCTWVSEAMTLLPLGWHQMLWFPWKYYAIMITLQKCELPAERKKHILYNVCVCILCVCEWKWEAIWSWSCIIIWLADCSLSSVFLSYTVFEYFFDNTLAGLKLDT